MLHPQHQILVLHDADEKSRRMMGWGFVAVFHILFVWALVNGLAVKAFHQVTQTLDASVILQPENPQTATPAPRVKLTEPTLPTEMAVPPVIVISDPTDTAPPPTSSAPPPGSAASGLAGTHTRPPYPPLATRLGEQGTVQLHVTISAAGDVTAARVTRSSGFADLDQSAVQWVIAHWKYRPATQNGAAVASSADAAVVFNLKQG